jgi:glycosyltransferase involved in cell wall biosynthesis
MAYNHKLDTISVIIPTFNRRNLLKRALSSVLTQTVKLDEVIVIDNGSSDQTDIMVSSSFPTIKYLVEKKRGVSAARNRGISFAQSNWIALLDSDDTWKPNKIEKQLQLANQNKDLRLIHTNEIWYRNGKLLNQMKKHQKSGGNIFEKSLELCCVSPSSSIIKKDVFNDYGFFDEKLEVCEDYDMWVRITAKEEIGYLSEPMVFKYGGHEDQLSKKFWGMDRFRIKSLEKNIENNWFSKEQSKAVYKILIEKLIIVSTGAKKRGNQKTFEEYDQKLKLWLTKSEKFDYEPRYIS